MNGMVSHGLRSASVAASGATADGSTARAAIMMSNRLEAFRGTFRCSTVLSHIVMRWQCCLCRGSTNAN